MHRYGISRRSEERKIAKIKDQKSVKALRFDPREHC